MRALVPNRFLASAIWLVTILSGLRSHAQSTCPAQPDYESLRQDEDYGYLRDRACRQDRWDALKYVEFESAGRFLTIGGEVRSWYQGFRNANWGVGPQDHNGYLLQRFSLLADFHVHDRIRFFAQLTSAFEVGENGGPRPVIDESKLFFEQAFADVAITKRKTNSLVLRLGREEFLFGSGRLVSPRQGPNVPQAFDGLALIWKTPSWHVTSFATKPVLNGTGFFDAPPQPGTTFWGAYAVRPSSETEGAHTDFYYLGLDKKESVFEIGAGREVRHTIGTRLWRKPGGWDYNSEALIQLGIFGSGRLRAWGTGHDTGYTFRTARYRPRIGVAVGATSGDDGDPTSPLGTSNPLFPTGIYFGQGTISLNGPSNLIRIDPQLKVELSDSVKVIADTNFFWRTSLNDGVYGLATNLLVSGQGNSERYVGSLLSAGVYGQISRHASLSAVYDHFFAGPFLVSAVPPRRSVDYAAVWATYRF